MNDLACFSGTAIGWAFLGAGVQVMIGISPDRRVNSIGGSNRRIVPPLSESKIELVHSDAHLESRENKSIGATISGSHSALIAVNTLPSADVLLSKPQAGHAKSSIVSGKKLELSSKAKADLSRHHSCYELYLCTVNQEYRVVSKSRSHPVESS